MIQCIFGLGQYILIFILMLASTKKMWNFDLLREIRKTLFNFWPTVIKYSDLVTSRVEKPFQEVS